MLLFLLKTCFLVLLELFELLKLLAGRKGNIALIDQLVVHIDEAQRQQDAEQVIDNTQQHSAVYSVDSGCHHQRTEAVDARFEAVIGAEAEEKSAQRSQQGGEGRRCDEIDGKECKRSAHDTDHTMDAAAFDVDAVRIGGEHCRAGKAHPHEVLDAAEVSKRQHKPHAQCHAKLPAAFFVGKVKARCHLAKADVLVFFTVLCIKDRGADDIPDQCHGGALVEKLARYGVPAEEHIRKAVHPAVAHDGVVACHQQDDEERERMDAHGKHGIYKGRCHRRNEQEEKRDAEIEERILDAIAKIDKAKSQHQAKQCNAHRTVLGTEIFSHGGNAQNGKQHDERRAQPHRKPQTRTLLRCLGGAQLLFYHGRI